MRRADVFLHGIRAGILEEMESDAAWRFTYHATYVGPPVSLNLPIRPRPYDFEGFPPFLEGLLPEGYNLDALLRALKIDRKDLFSQLLAVGKDLVGAVTVLEAA